MIHQNVFYHVLLIKMKIKIFKKQNEENLIIIFKFLLHQMVM